MWFFPLWCIYIFIGLNSRTYLFRAAILVININYARIDILQLIAYYLRRFHVLFYLLSLDYRAPTRKENYVVVPFSTNSVTMTLMLHFLFLFCLFLYIRFCTYNAIWCAEKHTSCFSNSILFFSLFFLFPDCYTIGHSLVDLFACSLACIHPVPSRVYLCRIFSSYYL